MDCYEIIRKQIDLNRGVVFVYIYIYIYIFVRNCTFLLQMIFCFVL